MTEPLKSSELVGTKTNYKNIKQQNVLATPQCRLSFHFRLREKNKTKIFGSLVVSLLPPANVYTRDKFRISAKSSKLAPQMSFTQHPFRNEVSGELENLADLFTKFARDSCSSWCYYFFVVVHVSMRNTISSSQDSTICSSSSSSSCFSSLGTQMNETK
jgi:hypothetical protein